MVAHKYNEYVVYQCVCSSGNAKLDELNINKEEVVVDVLVADTLDICFWFVSAVMSFFKTNTKGANCSEYMMIAT